jgi:hypothetical protein
MSGEPKSGTFNSRMQRAVDALRGCQFVYFYHLPAGIGLKTMEALVRSGMAEEVRPDAGPYAKGRAWRLTRTAL